MSHIAHACVTCHISHTRASHVTQECFAEAARYCGLVQMFLLQVLLLWLL